MSNNGQKPSAHDDDDFENMSEYDDLALLEQLETLREDMEDLGVTTLAEVAQRIEELHRQIERR